MELSEALIVNEIKNGNQQVYKSLFEQYFSSLVKFAYSFVYDEDVCKDIVQEVFVVLWDQRKKNNIKSLKWYLYTAVRNKCLTYLRNVNIKDKHSVYIIDYFMSHRTDDQSIEPELLKEVRDAIEKLPTEMRKIFELKYLHDLTMNDIAEDLNISLSTVKTQLTRAKKKLRVQLSNQTSVLFFLL